MELKLNESLNNVLWNRIPKSAIVNTATIIHHNSRKQKDQGQEGIYRIIEKKGRIIEKKKRKALDFSRHVYLRKIK